MEEVIAVVEEDVVIHTGHPVLHIVDVREIMKVVIEEVGAPGTIREVTTAMTRGVAISSHPAMKIVMMGRDLTE